MPSAIQMFQLPSVITLSIAATRMYRALTDFVSGITHMYDIKVLTSLPFPSLTICRWLYSRSDNLHKSNSQASRPHGNKSSFNPIEVTVDMAYEQYQMSRTGGHDPCISPELGLEEQKCEKPQAYEL